MTDADTIRNILTRHASFPFTNGDARTEALAALDRLVAERDEANRTLIFEREASNKLYQEALASREEMAVSMDATEATLRELRAERDEARRQAEQADEALVLTGEDARSWKAQANHNLGKWEAAEIELGESRRRALDGVVSAIRGSEKAEAERDNLREALETSVGCWEEDARGWRDVLSYFNAQPDADRHDAKELIAAIEQRASTVAENARIARAALAPKEDA